MSCAAEARPYRASPDVDTSRQVVLSGPVTSESVEQWMEAARAITRVGGEVGKDKSRELYFVIDSPGGSVVAGFKFLNFMQSLKQQGINLRCYVPTMAASMAFQIFLHCSERYALNNAFLLWHRVRTRIGGGGLFGGGGAIITAPLARDMAYELQIMDDTILDQLTAGLTDLDEEAIMFHLEKETLHIAQGLVKIAPGFMSAHEAISGLTIPENQARGLFGGSLFRPGEIIYIWEGYSE